MSSAPDMPLHMVRYGISRESQYFMGEFLNTYDLLVLNGTLAAYYRNSLTALVSARLGNKPFIVDPLTHAFQHSPSSLASGDGNKPKASVAKLAALLGEPFLTALSEDRALKPEDLKADSVVRDLADRVVEFQLGVLREPAEDSGDLDYYEFLGVQNALEPDMVIAPYFFMDETNVGVWAGTNERLLDATLAKCPPDKKVLFELVISQELLGSSELDNLLDHVLGSRVHGVAVWVDSLDEVRAPYDVLTAYVTLLSRIGHDKPVYILYGSYLPVALAKVNPNLGIAGVCHSLDYGESRPVVPVGGGLPSSKFYYPSLHARLPYEDAFRLAREFLISRDSYLSQVCGCATCTALMGSGLAPAKAFAKYGEATPVQIVRGTSQVVRNFPTSAARDLCVKHYLHSKHMEFTRNPRVDDVVRQLWDAARYAEARLGALGGRHCRLWAKVIEESQP